MLMNQILDSSNPLRDPDERSHRIKRSASVASLPTPPRTKHKTPRPHSSLSHHEFDGSGSASEVDDHDGDAKRTKRVKIVRSSKTASETGEDSEHSEDERPERKKRRTLRFLPGHDQEEEDENAFWTGRGCSSYGGQEKVAQVDEVEESSPSPALLRYRVKAPVSPPPSRRLPSVQATRAVAKGCNASLLTSVAPITPPRKLFLRGISSPAADTFKTPTKSAATKIWPKRDSPNNPFLVESSDKVKSRSEWDSSDDDKEVIGEARVREETPTPSYEEKPTITYVFRGQKATFQNPLYDPAPEVVAASKLPIDHPDYEAAEACPPKKLFFTGKRKSRDRNFENTSTGDIKHTKAHLTEYGTEETLNGKQRTEATKTLALVKESVPPTSTESPPHARQERERKETAAKNRLAPRDGLRAGAIFAERDEPVRRAIGPLRSA